MERIVSKTSPPTDLPRTAGVRIYLATLGRRAAADQRGATAVEYALIAAGIGAAVAATVYTLGSSTTANLASDMSQLF
jgi:Flp pilus assembly pilin Flp